MIRRTWGARKRTRCEAIGLAVLWLASSSISHAQEATTPDAPFDLLVNTPAAELAPDAEGTIWEAQIRDDMRRDIEAREQAAWREAERTRLAEEAARARLEALRAEADLAAGETAVRVEPIAAPVAAATIEAAASTENTPVVEAAAIAAAPVLESELTSAEPVVAMPIAAEPVALEPVVPEPVAIAPASPPEVAVASPPSPNTASEIGEAAESLLGSAKEAAGSATASAQNFIASEDLQRYAGLGVAFAIVFGFLARATRRRGDLMVHIVYPTELRGTFRVQVDSQRRRWRRRNPRTETELVKGGASSSTEHYLVARETPFRRLSCRKYFVTVDGVLQDPRTDEIIGHPFLQMTIYVRHRRTVRLDVDATPAMCPVDVRVLWDGSPVRSAAVASRGSSQRPVETEAGKARLQLAPGNYTIVAGSGDRVTERAMCVESFLPTRLDIDLADREGIVFKACPPAVDPYLNGHLDSAAGALTRDGQAGTAHRLLALRARENGDDAEAALHFEAAREWVEAAELHSTLGNYAHAGELFSRASDPISAAEMFQLAGELIRAGRAFEEAREFESAIECYRDAGDAASWVEALKRRGDVFEAARVALSNGLPTRGIRLLQRVSQDDPNYREACVLLADTFERERHFDLAARKLADYLGASKPDEVEPAIYARLADLHEKSGDLESALDVLEALRLRDPSFPNLATRAEHLRKARSAKRHLTGGPVRMDDSGPPTVLLAEERYEVLEEIGRGGMGVVSRARDRRLGRIVALKRLSENLHDQPRAVELFLREARAAAALNHPNIVTVYDADQEDGTMFITMELLDGTPLQQLLRRRGRLSAAEIARIGRQVCAGLSYAHARGVIHRDIKTANLFVGSDQRVKIMDFGLAKVTEEVRRGHSLVGGTPYYMAPEQTQGGDVDHRVDLYSLGVTLFELATGRVPFPDGDAAHHNRHSLPPNPLELAPDLDARLVELILDLLEKDPNKRPADASEVGRRLTALDPNPSLPPGSDDSLGFH